MKVAIAALMLSLLLLGCTANPRYHEKVKIPCPNCSYDYSTLIDICVQKCKTIAYVCDMTVSYSDLETLIGPLNNETTCICNLEYENLSQLSCPKRFPDAY